MSDGHSETTGRYSTTRNGTYSVGSVDPATRDAVHEALTGRERETGGGVEQQWKAGLLDTKEKPQNPAKPE